jgi:hypothetical protein
LHTGGDELTSAQGLAILQRNPGPAAPTLTGRHITPKVDSDNVCSQIG